MPDEPTIQVPASAAPVPSAANRSRARLHSYVAMAVVVGAELEGLKGETYAQLAQHTVVFWISLLCAIVVGYGNSVISTKPQAGEANPDLPPGSSPTSKISAQGK